MFFGEIPTEGAQTNVVVIDAIVFGRIAVRGFVSMQQGQRITGGALAVQDIPCTRVYCMYVWFGYIGRFRLLCGGFMVPVGSSMGYQRAWAWERVLRSPAVCVVLNSIG